MNKYITIDIGGTYNKIGIVNDSFEVEKEYECESYGNSHGGSELINNLIKEIKNIITSDIKGIAIGCPGVIDNINGLILAKTETIDGITGINIKELLENEFHLPTTVDNDVNCFGHFENYLGLGKKYDSFVVMTIGTGIGGTIFINNKIYTGGSFGAGEFGRMRINNHDFEEIASTRALVFRAKKIVNSIQNGVDVFNYLYVKEINELVNEFYNTLSIGISNILSVINPKALFIGGGITKRKSFFDELTPYLNKNVDKYYLKNTNILGVSKGQNSGFLGALVYHLQVRNKLK
jgi:predicted NBD/HSP70 family sugar kinase